MGVFEVAIGPSPAFIGKDVVILNNNANIYIYIYKDITGRYIKIIIFQVKNLKISKGLTKKYVKIELLHNSQEFACSK